MSEIGTTLMLVENLVRNASAGGLVVRGAFASEEVDGLPALPDGSPCRTVVLLGWTGGDQWPVFAKSSEAADGQPDPLNRWSKRLIDGIAAELGATSFYPFGGPPWFDFQSWALKAEPVHRSPLGLLIHRQWGLWHSYRGALGLREGLSWNPPPKTSHPCEECSDRPCLSACPVSAFAVDRPYDVTACRQHLVGPGEDCRTRACAARRACPIAPEMHYTELQATFHIRALLAGRSG